MSLKLEDVKKQLCNTIIFIEKDLSKIDEWLTRNKDNNDTTECLLFKINLYYNDFDSKRRAVRAIRTLDKYLRKKGGAIIMKDYSYNYTPRWYSRYFIGNDIQDIEVIVVNWSRMSMYIQSACLKQYADTIIGNTLKRVTEKIERYNLITSNNSISDVIDWLNNKTNMKRYSSLLNIGYKDRCGRQTDDWQSEIEITTRSHIHITGTKVKTILGGRFVPFESIVSKKHLIDFLDELNDLNNLLKRYSVGVIIHHTQDDRGGRDVFLYEPMELIEKIFKSTDYYQEFDFNALLVRYEGNNYACKSKLS